MPLYHYLFRIAIWDIIAAVPEEMPIPQWHLELVEERLNSHNPQKVDSWDEVKPQLLGKYCDG